MTERLKDITALLGLLAMILMCFAIVMEWTTIAYVCVFGLGIAGWILFLVAIGRVVTDGRPNRSEQGDSRREQA